MKDTDKSRNRMEEFWGVPDEVRINPNDNKDILAENKEYMEWLKTEQSKKEEDNVSSPAESGRIMQLRGDRRWLIGKYVRKKEEGVV